VKVQLVEETALFGEQALTQVAATLRNPVLAGDTLTYEVRVLQGEMPAKGGLVSVFSYAGSWPGILGPSCARTTSPDISAS